MHAYIRLRGPLGPQRWDDDLAWLSAHAFGPAESTSVDEFRPKRGLDDDPAGEGGR